MRVHLQRGRRAERAHTALHRFGHSLGLDIHEWPNANPSGETPMPAGAVCSAEPGIYIPGRFGVRIEDLVCVTDDGCEVLNSYPRELTVLGPR